MTPERWARMKDVFDAALDVPETRRAEYLEESCGSDAELRREVEALIEESREALPLARGTRLGPYEIVSCVGTGGMGAVYQAVDTRLNRPVAIKVPHEDRNGEFQREARAVAGLSHPNICALHDVGPNYLVMEYLSGPTLAERLKKGPLTLRECIEYGRQLASALRAAHERGVVHRDLKPGNIMLTESGAKLLDFGLARRELDGAPQAGTLAYMAPEQVEGGRSGARSDIFSFGAVLYEMATGRAAFRRETSLGTVAAIMRGAPPMAGVETRLAHVIARCLERAPERRFQRMAEVEAALAEPRRARSWRAPAVAAAIGLAVVAGSSWLRTPRTVSNPTAVVLTALPGFAGKPSLSPDGSKVAFVWDGEKQDNADVYVRQIGTNGQTRLTTSPAVENDPVWSPDDRWIAFTRDEPNGAESVMVIPPVGGPERKVAEFGAAGKSDCRLSWTPDGKWLAVSGSEGRGKGLEIWLVSVDTGERRRLTSEPEEAASDSNPAISPNGRWLAFSRGRTAHYWAQIWALPLSRDHRPAGSPRRLSAELYARVYGIAWMPDSRSIVYSAGSQERLWRLRLAGGEAPTLLNFAAPDAFWPTISEQRPSRLAYTWVTNNVNLWRLGTRVKEWRPWIEGRGIQALPRYSPDGRKIAFESTRTGQMQVWTCDADATHCAQITSGDRVSGRPRWSPDGQWLSLGVGVGGEHHVYVMRADGGAPRAITSGSSFNASASWSQDGRWIYFESNRSGRNEVWKAPSKGGPAIQVTFAGGRYPEIGPDGDLYYMKGKGTLVRAPVSGGLETEVLPRAIPDSWGLTREGVYFREAGTTAVRFLESRTRKVRVIGELDKHSGGFGVSPDGEYLVVTRQDHMAADLMLVEGYR